MRFVSALAAVVLSAPSLAAHAQGPAEPGAARIAPAETATSAIDLIGDIAPPPPPSDDVAADRPADRPALRAYHQAFQALAAGRRAEAADILAHIVNAYPGDPLAARAAELIRRLDARDEDDLIVRRPPSLPGEGRDAPANAFSRAELVVAQTIHGVGLGLELCLLAECDDSRAIGAAMVAGGGLGLGVSLLLSGDGVTPGHTAFLNAGTVWGGAAGFLTIGVVNPVADDVRAIPATMMAGQLAGLGLGHLLWRTTHGSSGDVALASSGGVWTDFLTLMLVMTVSNGDIEAEPLFGALLGGTALGLAGGALLADRFPMTRGRVLVIDGGGAVGTLVGVGSALIIQSDEVAPYFLFPAIGAVGGLVLTTYLTRDWNVDDGPDLALGVTPWEGGAMLNVMGSW